MNIPTETLSGPEWAYGCDACQFGLVVAPDIIPYLNLSEQRAAQCAEDMLLFCDCRAGFMYRQSLRRVYGAISMGTRQNLREHVMSASVPTIHGVQP